MIRFSLFRFPLLLVTILCGLPLSSAMAAEVSWKDFDPAAYNLNQVAINQVAKVDGFLAAQDAAIETGAAQFPDLAFSLRSHGNIFTLKFGHPEARVEAILRGYFGKNFDAFRATYFDQVQKNISSRNYTRRQVKAFDSDLVKRLDGNLDPGILATLLWLNYASQPGSEMSNGWTRDYSSAGDPKAMGLDLRMTFPMSWKARPGKHPHILKQWTDQNGTGLRMINLLVRDASGTGNLNRKETRAYIEQIGPDWVPDRATILDQRIVDMDSLPFARLDYILPISRDGTGGAMFIRSHIGLFKNRFIMLQCMTTANTGGRPDPSLLKRGLLGACFRVASSLVITNLWK